jgi:hypothetical protein
MTVARSIQVKLRPVQLRGNKIRLHYAYFVLDCIKQEARTPDLGSSQLFTSTPQDSSDSKDTLAGSTAISHANPSPFHLLESFRLSWQINHIDAGRKHGGSPTQIRYMLPNLVVALIYA